MANNIRGITIEIGAETRQLTSALSGVNRESRNLQSELKEVERLLKLDPSNVELLAQREAILAEQVENAEEKLSKLHQSERELSAQTDALVAAQEDLRARFEAGQVTQEQYENGMNELTNELEINARQHRALQREIIGTEENLEDLERQAGRANATLESFAARADHIGKNLTAAGKAIAPISGAVAGLGVAAIKVTADFDEAMSQVSATMGITAEDIAAGSEAYDALRAAAKAAGETTKFSASEAAEALNYLALAGYDYQKACDALVPILNLAAAGNMELAATSDMVTDSMSALGIEATTENLVKFGDELVKASQKSNTSVAQLGDAILTVGGTAKQLAGGTNELSTALGILADNGIKASEGGTALRNIILALTPHTKPAIEAFEALGVATYDAEGNLRPLNETFKDLNIALSQLTAEEKQEMLIKMFNVTDLAAVGALLANTATNLDELSFALETAGITAEETGINIAILQKRFEANGGELQGFTQDMLQAGLTVEQAQTAWNGLNAILVEGSTRFDQLSGYIADSNGAMQSAADVQIDNLKGQLTILSSQLQGLGITIGEALMPAIRAIVGAVQDFLTALANIDPQFQQVIIVVGAVVAALGPLLMLLGSLASSVTSLIGILPVVQKALGAVGTAMKFLAANPIVLIVAAIGTLIAILINLWQTNEDFRNNVIQLWENLKSFLQNTMESIIGIFQKAWDMVRRAFDNFGLMFDGAFQSFLAGMRNAVENFVPSMANAGRMLFEGLLTGMKNIWDGIANWVSEKVSWLTDKLSFWRSSQKEMSNDGGWNSHAKGLDYVPYDGYKAILHEGETVLTKTEANQYRNGQNRSTETIVNNNYFNIEGSIRNDRDVDVLAQKLNTLQNRAIRNRGVLI